VPSLYLIEGLPNALVVTVSVILLKDMGVDTSTVTFATSLLYLPWVVKPLWAPFVDASAGKRRWIVAMQLAMAAGLAAVAAALQSAWFFAVSIAAFWCVALFSATHDIAADGFYMLALEAKAQAAFVGIRSTCYRIATLAASGGVVWLAGRLISNGLGVASAWSIMLAAVAALFALAAVYHNIVLPTSASDAQRSPASSGQLLSDFGRCIADFFRKPHIATALLFMLFYRFPEALLSKVVPVFLKDADALALSNEQVGVAYGMAGVIGLLVGGIIGGLCVARYGLRRCLWPMALMLTVPSAFYVYLAVALPESMTLISTGLAIEQFGYGFGFTAYMMYLIYFCKGSNFATAHYALCTGIMAAGLMLPGMAAGWLQQQLGYVNFFIWIMVSCLLTFAACLLIMPQLKDEKN
jgi:PAT family beta-lactamase induction signal transducer AmpG